MNPHDYGQPDDLLIFRALGWIDGFYKESIFVKHLWAPSQRFCSIKRMVEFDHERIHSDGTNFSTPDWVKQSQGISPDEVEREIFVRKYLAN